MLPKKRPGGDRRVPLVQVDLGPGRPLAHAVVERDVARLDLPGVLVAPPDVAVDELAAGGRERLAAPDVDAARFGVVHDAVDELRVVRAAEDDAPPAAVVDLQVHDLRLHRVAGRAQAVLAPRRVVGAPLRRDPRVSALPDAEVAQNVPKRVDAEPAAAGVPRPVAVEGEVADRPVVRAVGAVGPGQRGEPPGADEVGVGLCAELEDGRLRPRAGQVDRRADRERACAVRSRGKGHDAAAVGRHFVEGRLDRAGVVGLAVAQGARTP